MADFNFGKFLPIGLQIIQHIPLVVNAVEALKGGKRGKEKEDAAVDLFNKTFPFVESIAGKDLINDPQVEAAIRSAMQAIVNVQNVVSAVRAAKVAAEAK